GNLLLVTLPLAIHPCESNSAPSPYAAGGWRKGWTETWTRAHTMRWMAADEKAYLGAWLRTATLELCRGLWGLIGAPFTGASWLRVVGACTGMLASLLNWHRIPSDPKRAGIESIAAC